MDYSRHYSALMNRARSRVHAGYCERHHITPRCLGGSDDPPNIVRLTPEEHFVAHQLLVKLNPLVPQLVWAAHLMASRPGNKLYGWVRRRVSDARRGTKQSPAHIAKLSAVRKGRQRSEEAKARTAASLTGLRRSAATRARMSEAAKRRGISAETRVKIACALRGPRGNYSAAHCAAIREGKRLAAERRRIEG